LKEHPVRIIPLSEATAKDWPGTTPFTPEELKEAYAAAWAAFTAEDLQKFTEIEEEGPPMEDFLAELEKAQEEHDRKKAP
jgi:hypothetical protein